MLVRMTFSFIKYYEKVRKHKWSLILLTTFSPETVNMVRSSTRRWSWLPVREFKIAYNKLKVHRN